jgi:hypothetical protein
MSDHRVLIDYTTLVSAANVLGCADAFYPKTTKNPYSSLLSGQATDPDSPMWLEVASLSDLLESVVIHETLCVLDVGSDDRNRELGRYSKHSTLEDRIFKVLQNERVLQELKVSSEHAANFQSWLEQVANSGVLCTSLVDSLFELLKQPAYANLPDLFSHSQTVYKFDGETIWSCMKTLIDYKELSRVFRKKLRENSNSLRLTETLHFYPEDILGFFLRGLYYNDVAKAERIPYHPHGGRSAIVMSDGLWATGVTKDYARVPLDFVKKLRREIASEVNSNADSDLFDLEVPPVLAAVLREANRPEDCLPIAIQMRNTPPAIAYRQCLEGISASDSGLKTLKLKADLEELKRNLRKQLLIESQTVSLGLWKFSFPIKVPGWMFRSIYLPNQRHMQFVRDLAIAVVNLRNLEGQMIKVFSWA